MGHIGEHIALQKEIKTFYKLLLFIYLLFRRIYFGGKEIMHFLMRFQLRMVLRNASLMFIHNLLYLNQADSKSGYEI